MASSAAPLDEFFKAYVVSLCEIEKNCDVAMFFVKLSFILHLVDQRLHEWIKTVAYARNFRTCKLMCKLSYTILQPIVTHSLFVLSYQNQLVLIMKFSRMHGQLNNYLTSFGCKSFTSEAIYLSTTTTCNAYI